MPDLSERSPLIESAVQAEQFEEFGWVEIAGHRYMLFCCFACGATVAGHAKKRHQEWHDRLTKRVDTASMGVVPMMFGEKGRL